jgi:hypothetical protein
MLTRTAHSPAASILESFARKVAETRVVWTVSGEDGLARVPSSTRRGRDVTLCWATSAEAERWARLMARHPRINPIMLGNFVANVLPKLRQLNRLLAPGWIADPLHPQFEPAEVEQSLLSESLALFMAGATAHGHVFILEDELGPTFAASTVSQGQLVLPCWTERDHAESQLRGFWSEMLVSEIGLEAFVGKTLPWVAGIGRGASLAHGIGGPALELGALELAARLMREPVRRSA